MNIGKVWSSRIAGIVILSCFSCTSRNADFMADVEVPEHHVSVSDDDRIFGQWKCCNIISGGNSIETNMCPEVVFSRGGEGLVRMPSGGISGFNWEYRSGKLSIRNTGDIENSVFKDSLYLVSINFDKGTYNAVLDASSSSDLIYLVR